MLCCDICYNKFHNKLVILIKNKYLSKADTPVRCLLNKMCQTHYVVLININDWEATMFGEINELYYTVLNLHLLGLGVSQVIAHTCSSEARHY